MHGCRFAEQPDGPGGERALPVQAGAPMHSCLYAGYLQHRRFAPRRHNFRYRLCMVYLDLAELDTVFKGRWLWSTRRAAPVRFCRADYLGDPAVPLEEAVRNRVAEETGCRPQGPVRMLTTLRQFGVCFNPVTFYYCFDMSGRRIETIVAQITNTPWNERHTYVLRQPPDSGSGAPHRHRFAKAFHVSPFMPMALEYEWSFTAPGEALGVHMCNREHAHTMFSATLRLQRQEITSANLAQALIRFPVIALRTLAAIYLQALRLWIKRVPFHTHPHECARPVASGNVPERTT